MNSKIHNPKTGTILLEVVIGAGLMVILAGTGILASKTVTEGFRSEVIASQLNSVAAQAADEVASHLRSADLNAVLPPPVPGDFSPTIDFQAVALPGAAGVPPAERLTFENDPGDPNDGLDNDGDGMVDEGRLVWIENAGLPNQRRKVLANWVPENSLGEIAGNLLDDNNNGLVDEPGVCFEYQEGRILFHMTLERRTSTGFRSVSTITRTITLRNTL